MTPLNVAQAMQRTLSSAKAFSRRHSSDPAISLTYRYFTRHSVARLNQMRLLTLLEIAEDRSTELRRPLRILDLACGGGIITCAFAALGHRALGLDLNPAEIGMARRFAQEENLDGKFLRTDLIADPDWERLAEAELGGKPDIVTLAYALHHIAQVAPFLARLERWLEAPSQLLINEENPRSPMFQLKHHVRSRLQRDTGSEWHRTFPEWRILIEAHGFTMDKKMTGLDLLPGVARVKPDRCWSLVFMAQRMAPGTVP